MADPNRNPSWETETVGCREKNMSEQGEYPFVRAAFINAIADEGTKEEAVTWLQKTWDELCSVRTELAAEKEAREKAETERDRFLSDIKCSFGNTNAAIDDYNDMLARATAAEARVKRLEEALAKWEKFHQQARPE